MTRRLDQLYVFQEKDKAGAVIDAQRFQVLLTLSTHTGLRSYKEIFYDQSRYYAVFFSDQANGSAKVEVQFFPGHDGQYAVRMLPRGDQNVGLIGEEVRGVDFKAYMGVRSSPAFADVLGYRKWLGAPCVRLFGYTCTEDSEPANYFRAKNSAVIGLDLAVSILHDDIVPSVSKKVGVESQFYVWAKSMVIPRDQ
jgi:hypothetical protein